MKELYFFRNPRIGVVYMTAAGDSDLALLSCLRETGWNLGEIIYEGFHRVFLGTAIQAP